MMSFIEKNNESRRRASVSGQKWLKVVANASVFILMLALFGCGSAPKKNDNSTKNATPTTASTSTSTTQPSANNATKSGGYYLDDGPGANPPPNLDAIADAVPRQEPLHRGANKPYVVFGKTYVPNVATDNFKQQGIASWYGRKFHGQKTSNGETYDMYAMTAAHPTLPLPSYVRVTNPVNNKSVVVRVNDRGPFHSDRIVDLSFAAANRLDIARRGSGIVILERVFANGKTAELPVLTSVPTSILIPMTTAATTVLSTAVPLVVPSNVSPIAPSNIAPSNIAPASPITADQGVWFLQLGAFSSPDNADIFRARMSRELEWNREPIAVSQKDGLYRVRLGPYKNREEAEAIQARVKESHDFSPIISKP